MAAAAVIALGLNLYAASALSSVDSVVRDTAWAVGRIRGQMELSGGHAYMGLSSIIAIKHGNVKDKRRWSNIDCDDFTIEPQDDEIVRRVRDVHRCQRCKKRVNGMATTVIISAVTTLGTIRFALMRATPESDARFWKGLGVVLGCLAFATAVEPLIAFRRHCTKSTTDGIKMRNGPGFIALSIAVCIKGLSVLMHLSLRVPDLDDDDDDDDDDDAGDKTVPGDDATAGDVKAPPRDDEEA